MKYRLEVFIDTDDDCPIKYLGETYCYYADNLRFSVPFESKAECYEYLLREVIVVEGYKASKYVSEALIEFITLDKQNKCWFECHGNQTISISIHEVKDSAAERKLSAIVHIKKLSTELSYWTAKLEEDETR